MFLLTERRNVSDLLTVLIQTLNPTMKDATMKYNSIQVMPLDLLKGYIDYNRMTGQFTHLKPDVTLKRRQENGRLYLSLKGMPAYVPASKVAWYMVHGVWSTLQIMPLNGDASDLRLSNLGVYGLEYRPDHVSVNQHAATLAAHESALSDAAEAKTRLESLERNGTGVSLHTSGKWRARVSLKGEQVLVGMYDSEAAATAALRDYLTEKSLYTSNATAPASPYKAVSWNKRSRKWRVQFKNVYKGEYASVELAIARAKEVLAEMMV